MIENPGMADPLLFQDIECHKIQFQGATDYSLRSLHRGLVIEPGTRFYALAYILPYEADGSKIYCAVDTSGKDVESWGKEFGIPHFLIFEMSFF